MGATQEGTARFFKKHPAAANTPLGRTGWQVSGIGFGGYRVHDSDPTHAEALRLALHTGCNLIDTSSNYTDGGSERLVGRVLEELIGAGLLERDEVIVVTKAGYVQGENMQLARGRIVDGKPFAEMVEFSEECWHCISPEFLAEQLDRSLMRLGLDKVDIFLLHNPEYFLRTSSDHAEYYRRIRQAFEYLESEVKRGRIQYYGVSSNTFPEPKDTDDYTSLETVARLAEEIGPGNHFAAIQFPLNLFEAGAFFEDNNSGKSVLAYARERGLATLVNRPLNAFVNNRMLRIADFSPHTGESVSERFRAAMSRTTDLETRYPGKAVVPVDQIAWGHIIKENFGRLADVLRWREILDYQIRPGRDEAVAALREAGFAAWCDEYQLASDELFMSFSAMLESEASIESKALATRLDQAALGLESTASLSRKALRIYRSLPGLHCVLVGMRRPEYVRDALAPATTLSTEQALSALKAAVLTRQQ